MNENVLTSDMMFATEDQLDDPNAVADFSSDSRKYLIFVSDDLKLGVDADNVVEILTNHVITYLPKMPGYIRGIINLRGQIVPVLDIRLRLGKMPKDDCLIIVLNIDETYLGILVDSVDQMADIPTYDILPVPAQSSQLLVSGMCTLPGSVGTMMTLACDQLMPNE